MDTKPRIAAWGGFDLSTTGLTLGVRSRDGVEDCVQTKMRGATQWKGQPAFSLRHVPRMVLGLIDRLRQRGWTVQEMAFSFSVRQHDMVVLDKDGSLILPALSWQCNAATKEVLQLRRQGAEQVVGRIEPRFILPKLMWARRQDPKAGRRIAQVMTTGDWIAQRLTGRARLSTSDALSNGLLDQRTKRLADSVMEKARLRPDWFPRVVPSGRVVGPVTTRPVPGADAAWMRLKQQLHGATLVAGLGDNHATGVGCGLDEEDFQTVVVSAGTSGTINRVCAPGAELAGAAACFEFYRNRLLLMMLADCCKWYDRFVARQLTDYRDRLDQLNEQIERIDFDRIRRVLHRDGKETYPPGWERQSAGEKAASTQLSIMLELLQLVRAMLDEVGGGQANVQNFVLTGGLSQSRFFQQVFHAGIRWLVPKARVLISARQGPLRYQTAAYGALLNAMRPEDPHAATRLCPIRSATRPNPAARSHLTYLLRSYGL